MNLFFCQGFSPRSRQVNRGVGLILGLVLVWAGCGPVSLSRAEDLFEVYQLALEQDPQFRAVRLENRATQETVRQAWAQFLPTLGFQYQQTGTTQEIKSSDNSVEDLFAVGKTNFAQINSTINFRLPLFQPANTLGLAQAREQLSRSDLELVVAGQELINRVAERYFQALAAQEDLLFARAEQTAVQQQYTLASNRFAMGLAPVTDLHDARARLAAVDAQAIEAENLLDDALQGLEEVTGFRLEGLKDLQSDFPFPAVETSDDSPWVTAALKLNPAIQARQHAAKVARYEVGRQRSGHSPTLDLVAQWNRKDTDGTLFGGGSDVATTDVMLELNVPIYQGGYVNSRTREAAQLHKRAQEELEQEIRAVVRQTRAAYRGINGAISRVAALQQAVIAQDLALEGKREGFKSGLYTSLAVLDAERDLYQAKRDYAQARYDFILNTLRLKQSVGMLRESHLQEINTWLE